MQALANICVLLVACLHICFILLKMIYWTTPPGMKIFGLKPEFAQATRKLAMNQGLYNGFLAAGLIWSMLDIDNGYAIKLFFPGRIMIAVRSALSLPIKRYC